MGKLIRIEFFKIRRDPAAWLVVLFTLGQSVFFALIDRYDAYIAYYPRLEYIIYTYSTGRWFGMAALFLTAYVIAGDFSMRTVQNVLCAGIDRRKYYFARLTAMALFFGALFVCGNAACIAIRIVREGRVNTALSPGELLLLLMVMALQVTVYVAVANLVSICCKRQALAVIAGEALLFAEILLRINLAGEAYYTDPGRLLQGPAAYGPMYVMENADYYVTAWGSLFCFGFLKYALSAAGIIIAAALAGYMCLTHSEMQ